MTYEIVDYKTRKKLGTAATREDAKAEVRRQREAGNKDAVYRPTTRQRSDGPAALRKLF